MNNEPPPKTKIYTCSRHVRWVNDTGATLLVDSRTLYAYCLQGIQAAIWRWLALSYPLARVTTHLAQWQSISIDDANRQLVAILDAWAIQGLLDVVEGEDRG